MNCGARVPDRAPFFARALLDKAIPSEYKLCTLNNRRGYIDIKPWHPDFFPALKPLQRIWLFFQSQTPWKKVRLKRAANRQSFFAMLKQKIKKIAAAFHLNKMNTMFGHRLSRKS
jgi:hypothetical protein